MGFFNTIKMDKEICPNCKGEVLLNIQFKYGEKWMHHYDIGDEIIWAEDESLNIGERKNTRILVSAISEECPICKACSDYIVKIENNIVKKVYVDDIGLSAERQGYRVIG